MDKKLKLNWLLILMMSIFFGMFGVDRFMMGRVGSGVAKLLITVFTLGLFGWIWWLVDVILIASKHEFNGIEWVDTTIN
jgi:TM2 domain-containing membrane protein YozV